MKRKPNDPRSPGVRLAEAEEMLDAIRSGHVDAMVIAGRNGPQVFTLQGADHAYRALIESMNEGALMISADKTILYANQCFARMVKCPLEQVMGSSLLQFLSVEDQPVLRSNLNGSGEPASRIQATLSAGDGSQIPTQISIRPLPDNHASGPIYGLVVTDMTESRRTGKLLRALSRRVVAAQEAERKRLALELHDSITQHLCAILFRFQAVALRLPGRDGPLKTEVMRLHQMLGRTADDVERISRDLRPGVLDHLGLMQVVRVTCTEFADRTRVRVKRACRLPGGRLPADIELALYRILQEALRNVEKHARARHVTVSLQRRGAMVRLVVKDDGTGFDPNQDPVGSEGKDGLGLVGLRERAGYVDGTVTIKSARRSGTEIDVRIPLPARIDTAARSG